MVGIYGGGYRWMVVDVIDDVGGVGVLGKAKADLFRRT